MSNSAINQPKDISGTLAQGSNITITGNGTLNSPYTIASTGGSAGSTLGIYNVKDYGALGNGTTDDTAAIQSAFNAASASTYGGIVFYPPGTYLSGQIIIMSKTSLIGSGPNISVLKAKNGLTTDFYISQNFSSEHNTNYEGYSTMSYTEVSGVSFTGGTYTALSSGQTDVSTYRFLLKWYGWIPNFHDIEFNGFEGGLYTEYSNNQPHNPFENYAISDGKFRNINAKNYARAGWVMRGPHDSDINNIRLFGGDYDTPDFDFLADNNGNFGAQGSFVHDLHCRSTQTVTGYNAIIRVGLNGDIYAEGGSAGAVLIETNSADLRILTGYVNYAQNNNNNAAVVIRSSNSSNPGSKNHIDVVAYYGNVYGDLVRIDNTNGGGNSYNIVTARINDGVTVTGAMFKIVGNVGDGYFSGLGGNPGTYIFDIASYTGGNNSWDTRQYGTAAFSDYTKVSPSDRVETITDNYPDYGRITQYQYPIGSTAFKFGNTTGTALIDVGGMQIKNGVPGTAPTDFATVSQLTSSSSGSNARIISVISAATIAGSAANTDYVYFASGTFTLTLPTAVSNNNSYMVKNTGNGIITISTTSGQTIDGKATSGISTQNDSLTYISNNTNWGEF